MRRSLVVVKRGALLFLVLAVATCTFDYEGAFSSGTATSSAPGSASSVGASGPGGGGAATSSSSVSGQGGSGSAGSGGESSSATCVEPVLPCGADDQPCCLCGAACGPSLACDGVACRCGAAGQPCCGGTACDDAASLVCSGGSCVPCGQVDTPCCQSSTCNTPYLNCVDQKCLNCCGQCKAVDGMPVKHNFAASGGDCHQAVKERCRNLNGCNGGSPPNCCATHCVTVTGYWGVCP